MGPKLWSGSGVQVPENGSEIVPEIHGLVEEYLTEDLKYLGSNPNHGLALWFLLTQLNVMDTNVVNFPAVRIGWSNLLIQMKK